MAFNMDENRERLCFYLLIPRANHTGGAVRAPEMSFRSRKTSYSAAASSPFTVTLMCAVTSRCSFTGT